MPKVAQASKEVISWMKQMFAIIIVFDDIDNSCCILFWFDKE